MTAPVTAMPKLTGLQLYEKLREQCGDLGLDLVITAAMALLIEGMCAAETDTAQLNAIIAHIRSEVLAAPAPKPPAPPKSRIILPA